jgi:hypothetical protein
MLSLLSIDDSSVVGTMIEWKSQMNFFDLGVLFFGHVRELETLSCAFEVIEMRGRKAVGSKGRFSLIHRPICKSLHQKLLSRLHYSVFEATATASNLMSVTDIQTDGLKFLDSCG